MRLIDADELMLRLENINLVIGKSNLMDIIAKAESVSGNVEYIKEQKEEKSAGMYFICDRRACEQCDQECSMTADITHAENWVRDADGEWIEVEK